MRRAFPSKRPAAKTRGQTVNHDRRELQAPAAAAQTVSAKSERLIRLPQVLTLVGIGKTTVYAMIKSGEFPRPRKVRNISLWVESEVQNWIRGVVEDRGERQA
ncbi:AlpA family phage regulatory protein [Paraburkholderia nemoris]|uniref:helix-turn-helix transcriptional regulator n=1 Tax=Paraburkholderia nemoris TaxID=2793076 RepID=UPI0038B8EC2D